MSMQALGGAFLCCIDASVRSVWASRSIFAKGFAISDQACRRDTVARINSPPLAVSQLSWIFVSLTGIEKPVLQAGLRPDKIVISDCIGCWHARYTAEIVSF